MPCVAAEPHWTAYVSAFGTPLVALIAGLIAYRQWRTAQDRLKFDLYEKRLSVYEATMRLLAKHYDFWSVNNEELQTYRVATRSTKWLFNDEIDKYLRQKILRNCLSHQSLEEELKGLRRRRTEIGNCQKTIRDFRLDRRTAGRARQSDAQVSEASTLTTAANVQTPVREISEPAPEIIRSA